MGEIAQEHLNIIRDGATVELRLNRPPRNLLVPELMRDLRTALAEADSDEEVRAIVLTGEGEVFCGGLDIPELRARDAAREFATAAVELVRIFPTLGKLVVSAVNGDALALGYALVCCSDLAVAVRGAQIGTFEASVGSWPMIAQIAALKRLPPRQALENIVTGTPVDTERALQMGVVNVVVDPGELAGRVAKLVEEGTRAGAALAVGRRSFYRFADQSFDQALDEALEEFATLFGSKD